MSRIKTTPESLSTDLTFEDVEENTIYGVFDSVQFKLYYREPEIEEYDKTRGNIRLTVLGPSDDPESEGGIVFYVENHCIPTDLSAVASLFERAHSVAREIATNDDIYACPHCDFIVHEDWKTTRELLFTFQRSNTTITTQHSGLNNLCVGMKQWIPPIATVYSHKQENIFFSQEELDSCDTLLITKEYPPKNELKITQSTQVKLEQLLEEHPEVFAEDIDKHSLRQFLAYCETSELSTQLVDRNKLTYR